MTLKKMKPIPVLVEWNDACTHEGRQSGSLEHRPYRVHTVGWCLRYDDIGITVCTDLDQIDVDWWREERFIPAGMIIKVRRLDTGKKLKEHK